MEVPVKLRKIYIRNFETVKESELEFPESGLCLVIGQNDTKASVASIGAGKTALGEAISRTLLGVRGRYDGSGLGAYSADNLGNKNTMVRLECLLDGKELTIWSAYKCKEKEFSSTGESLRFVYDGNLVERGDIKETRAELNALLGVNRELAEHTVHVDGDKLQFNKLSERQTVELFMSALTHTNWDDAQKRAKSTLDNTKAEQSSVEGSIATCQRLLAREEENLGDLEEETSDIKQKINNAKANRQSQIKDAEEDVKETKGQIAELREEQKGIKAQIKELESSYHEANADLELQLSRLKSSNAEVSNDIEDISSKVGSAEAQVSSAKRQLKSLDEPDNCPTCGKAWDKQHSAEVHGEAQRNLEEKTQLLAQLRQKRTTLADRRFEIQEEIKDVEKEIQKNSPASKIEKLSDRYETLDDDIDVAQGDLTSAEKRLARVQAPIDESEMAVHLGQIKASKTKIKELQEELKGYEQQAIELATTIAVIEYWHKAFGPTGLPNMIISDSVGYMTHIASHLSSVLTGGLLDVSFAASRTLASNAERPELVISVTNPVGSKKLAGSSKGEGGVSNIIVAETLFEIGKLAHKIGYRWLDEAVKSQDAMVRGAVYSYVREQCRAKGLLTFVVDHSQDVEAHADHVLLAHKSPEGFTTYRFIS